MSARERNQRNRSVSLRGHLTRRVLLIVGISLVLTGAPAVWFLANQLDDIGTSFERDRETLVRDVAGTHTRTQAVSVARRIDAFLLSRIIEAKAWASSPVVLDAARAGYERHVREGLPNLTVDEIEDRFLTRKSLGVSPQANAYLMRQIASSPYFAEVFFTDSNGFNVGLTNPTSDFVQSDEDWWQEAWSDFLSIGEIGYDDSAGVWSVDISVRLDDPATGELLGVMKTVLAIDSVQHIADQTVETIPGGRVTVVTKEGALIAETNSGHARERVMNPEVNFQAEAPVLMRTAFGSERAGLATDEAWLSGYARTGAQDTYAAVSPTFSGFDWLAVLQRPVDGVLESITTLHTIENALREWRMMLPIVLGVVFLVSLLLTAGLIGDDLRRLAASIHALREMAERSVQGKPVEPATIERPEELVRLNRAIHRLCQESTSARVRSKPREPGA